MASARARVALPNRAFLIQANRSLSDCSVVAVLNALRDFMGVATKIAASKSRPSSSVIRSQKLETESV